jgi:hypothetical protein
MGDFEFPQFFNSRTMRNEIQTSLKMIGYDIELAEYQYAFIG